jgi:phosphoglycerate dehydrogenase-like enzyme
VPKPKTLIVTVPDMIGDEDLAPLRAVSEVDYRELPSITEQDLANACEGYDYLMLNYDVAKKLSDGFYQHPGVQRLKAISADITGMDWASPKGARDNDVILLNIPHYSTESVAESVLAEVLLHSRQRHSAYVDELRGRDVQARKGINLLGKTAGVIGLGSIGTRVVGLLEAFGMQVITWNRSPKDGYDIVPLDELFARSTVICVCVKTVKSGEESNVGLVSDALLARCQAAIIINLANSDLVDHKAMLERINLGAVAGYSVDRTTALLDSPLAKSDAVHMPPANAWFSDESLALLRETWVGNVTEAIDGRLQNVYAD